MKRIIFLLPVVLIALAACNLDNSGYPKKVRFSADGGTTWISGEYSATSPEIISHSGKTLATPEYRERKGDEEDDTFYVSYDWLTVKGGMHDNVMMLTAQPNTTGQRRKLRLTGMDFDEVYEIMVTQMGD